MSSRQSKKRIALSGYYGFDNAGDEAVLAGLIKAFRETPGGKDVALTALSIAPQATVAQHGIAAAHRYKIGQLLRALAGCDLLISGGGSLLQDVTSRHSIFYYLGVVRAAQIMGKKTMFCAQGIGPLLLPRSRKLTAAVARRCDALTVRDAASAELLREIGVVKPQVTVTADPALLLGSFAQHGRGSGAAISLRDWPQAPGNFAESVASACYTSIGAPVISSLTMSPSDSAIHNRFFAAYHRDCGLSPAADIDQRPLSWEVLTEMANAAALVVGMRLHALILAAVNGVPSVALAYDPKVSAFMESCGQGDAVFDIRDSDSGKLTALIDKIWSERVQRAECLSALLPTLRASALRNAEIALELLPGASLGMRNHS